MNFMWNLRLLGGPLRPFVVSKLVDALRERLLVARLRNLPTPTNSTSIPEFGIAPLPSQSWLQTNAGNVLAFARAMRDGKPALPQIECWRVGDPDPESVDVRSVHELSRMHHWCAYALAAHIDPDETQDWCDLLADEIVTFAAVWPAEHGTHWRFPMGTAIRVHSMLVAWDWARRTGCSRSELDHVVAASACDHSESVWVRRERRGGLSTSHYAANLLGLLAVARYLPTEPSSRIRGQFAARELRRELRRQILDDGMSNEASTGYHRQIVDTFVHARALLRGYDAKTAWTDDDHLRLDRAVARCHWLEHAGMPLIGDNDDGMTMKLTGFRADCSYLYDVASSSAAVAEHAPDFGLYVFERGHMRVTLRNGPVGQFGKGGHAHQDQNSITVCVDDLAFIIDPGSSEYTRDTSIRNAERHVSRHATVWWQGSEQLDAPIGQDGLFWLLADRLTCTVEDLTPVSIGSSVAHRAGHAHRRSITVEADAVHVLDVCSGGSGDVCAWFPLHPDVSVNVDGATSVQLQRADVICELTWNNGELRIDGIQAAPTFGRREATHRLGISGNPDLHWTLKRRVPAGR